MTAESKQTNGAHRAPLQIKHVLALPREKSLLDTASLRDAQPDVCARDFPPRKASSPNTILRSASRGRRILSASAGLEHSFHEESWKTSSSGSSSNQKAEKDGCHRPPLQRANLLEPFWRRRKEFVLHRRTKGRKGRAGGRERVHPVGIRERT